MKIEELVKWSEPETIQTKAGEKTVRKAAPTPEFWNIYKANKEAIKQAGVSLSKYRDQWELAWWNSTITPENIEQKKELIEKSKAIEATIEIPVNPNMAYLPYQRGGIQFLSERENVLLGDEMGLGKTIQVIGYMNLVRPQKTLIIVPASLKLNWQRELKKWLVYPASIQVIGPQDPFLNKDITIVNYDLLKRYPFTHTWDLVALDEGHYIKNTSAARTKAVHKLQAKKKIVATGTPILNRPQELFSILNFLDPKKWPKFYPYAFRYCDAKRTRFGLDTSGASNLEELQRILRETVMIRRLKAEVLKDLPEKRRELILIDQDEELAALVERERDLLSNIRDKELSRFSPEFTEMARVRHDQGVAKAKYVVSHIEDLLESIDKIVVMAWHTDVINILKEGLEKHNPVTVTGSTKLEDRQANVDRFQTDPNCKVFIGNIQAAGVGLTLTAASWLCFAEGDWTPGKISQAEDRIHRIGAKNTCNIQHLVVDGSIDCDMAETIIEKQNNIDKALDNSISIEAFDPIKEILLIEPERKEETPETEFVYTQEEAKEWHMNLRRIAAMDEDKARSINGRGFNKIDGEIGHKLAELPTERLSSKQVKLVKKLANKYRGQLS